MMSPQSNTASARMVTRALAVATTLPVLGFTSCAWFTLTPGFTAAVAISTSSSLMLRFLSGTRPSKTRRRPSTTGTTFLPLATALPSMKLKPGGITSTMLAGLKGTFCATMTKGTFSPRFAVLMSAVLVSEAPVSSATTGVVTVAVTGSVSLLSAVAVFTTEPACTSAMTTV